MFYCAYRNTRVNSRRKRCHCSINYYSCFICLYSYVLLNNHLGWIKSQDPFGWFQWYCRFYLGRRTKDDLRQIGRWKSFDGRFKKNLINRIKKANTKYSDYTISPAIRQSLLHWGIEVTERDVK